MYEAFFGLRNRPFSPLPRVETYIPLAPVREPFEALVRCVTQEQGIGVLTAPSGAGKSLVCRLLQQRFSDQCRTILLTTARFPTRRALLQAILFELKHPFIGLSEQEARLRVLDLLQASPAPQNRMLLIVDEAHLLSARGLEELRTLTDYEIAGTPCVSLMLSGQLELEELLTTPEMNAFNQRVGCHACIEPLTFEESSQYLRERLRHAGNDGLTIFTPEAIQLICSASEGNPRRLNQLSDHSLLLAYAEETRPVDVSVVRSALLDLRELPLHWNAPLDLTWTSDQNPLERFAETHAVEDIELGDDSWTECDTDFDKDEVAAFETSEPGSSTDSASSVFEVGSPLDASALDMLFEATRFVLPGEPADTHPSGLQSSHFETSPSPPTCAFETAPLAGEVHENTTSGYEVKDQMMFMEVQPDPMGESSQEWALEAAPQASLVVNSHSIRSEFEELAVDDAYAAIDRQLESSQPRWTPPTPVLARQEVAEILVPEMANVLEEVRCTQLETAQSPVSQQSPTDLDLTITEVQPMLDETQLLDFINEISVDVRRYRQESEPSDGPVDHSAPPSSGLQQPPQRQAPAWQFDVVEPESAEPPHDPARYATQHVPPDEQAPPLQETAVSAPTSVYTPTSPTVEACADDRLMAERPYAQLFTRLQRLRRRVEAVMK